MEKHKTLDGTTTMSGASGASSKLKRAFSMPRNPFQGSRTADSGAANNQSTEAVGNGNGGIGNTSANSEKDDESRYDAVRLSNGQKKAGDGGGEKKIFRRLSVKKFINRIAQQMSYVNRTAVGNHKFDKLQASHTSTLRRGTGGSGGEIGVGNFVWPPDTVPGVIGLRNHGNTCFMNAVLQCLSHTDILAQYFVLDLYKADLKRRNKINAKKFGTKGELTEQLALVLKSLWTCKDAPDYSSNFKAVVDRYGSQFRSSTQHDAQEFLFWLLDKVHEDLNTATKRKYKTIKNNGRSDEAIAAETLANYVRCNNSFVQAVFQAQFRSSLSCPTCGKQSNTFDPFYCLSVPLPQLSQQPVLVKVIYASQQPKQVKLGLGIPHGSPVLALREQLHADTGIALDRMILTEICESGFSRVFCDSHLMASVRENDPLYCIECPAGPCFGANSGSGAGGAPDSANGTKIVLCLCNGKRAVNGHVKRFGTPFCLVVNRDISYNELQKLLLKELSGLLRSEVFAFATPAQSLFRMRLQDPSCDADTYLEATVEHPLFTEMIELALSVLPSDAGPTHVKLLLEWTDPERFFSDMGDPFVEHESVSQMREKIPASSALTLEQCFEHYTKAETLGQDNAWKCPHCQEYLPVVKTLGLWSLPDIMVIHLKRFRQQQLRASTQAAKLTNLVKFPLHGFDMTPHLARDQAVAHQQSQSITLERQQGYSDTASDNWSPWRKIMRSGGHATQTHSMLPGGGGSGGGGGMGTGRRQPLVVDNRYDLYAVCYHQGDTLETGHYTAACKNPYDGQWYRFDDQRVSNVPNDRIDDEIINNEAYLLFYQRRKLTGSGSGGECSGSSTSSSVDHWVSKIIVPSPSPTPPPPTTTHTSTEGTLKAPVAKAKVPMAPPATNSITTTPQKTITSPNFNPVSDLAVELTTDTEQVEVAVPNSVDKCGTNSSKAAAASPTEKTFENSPVKSPTKEAVADITSSNTCSCSPTVPPVAVVVPTHMRSAIGSDAPEAKELTINSAIAVEASKQSKTVATTSSNTDRALRSAQVSERQQDMCPVVSKVKLTPPPAACVDKHDRIEQQLASLASAAGGTTTAVGGGRFSLPSAQQFQDILWRENMSDLMLHRPSSLATYKGMIEAGDTVSLIRGANACSKDTLLFIDQQGHGLDRVVLDDDDDPDNLLPAGSASHALWISPVTPHKLITVSPKN